MDSDHEGVRRSPLSVNPSNWVITDYKSQRIVSRSIWWPHDSGGRLVASQKDPLRSLTDPVLHELKLLRCFQSTPAEQVAYVTMILAAASVDDHQMVFLVAARRSRDPISHLGSLFNIERLSALSPRRAGRMPHTYEHAIREWILQGVRREPIPEAEGATTWSLVLNQA